MSKPHTAADCKAALREHGSTAAAARALGMPASTFRDRLNGKPPAATKADDKPPAVARGRSLDEFRATYDKDTIIPQKIDAAIAELGKDGWAYEMEFVKLAGVGLSQLAAYRDAYAEHIVTLNRESKRAWAGSKALAAKMRAML